MGGRKEGREGKVGRKKGRENSVTSSNWNGIEHPGMNYRSPI